uniref:LPD23 domain-containing protein n=1 Tax=uncultured Campylobacter sp. TaxID=218934 RepID=UPI003413DEA7
PQRGSAAILGGEDAKNAAGDELVGRYGSASGDSAADAAASKQRVVSAQDAPDQGGATLKSEPQGGDLAAKEGAGSPKQGAKLNEGMKKGFVNVNLTSHLAGGLSGGALGATDEEGKFSPERFAAGFIAGLGGVAVIRKGFRASMKAYAAKQAKVYPTLANDRPDLFAQALSDEIKSRAKTTLFNAAEFAKTKVANKTGLDFEPQIFAGEKAYAELKYAPVKADKLSKAQAMAKEGKNELEIWRDTGWFRDKDGAWKFEIGDGDAKLNPKFQSGGKLGDLLKHDELFKAYPELRDVKVVKMQSDAPSSAMLAKDAGQKEKRGIYNVTYNNKIATYVKQDLDQIEGALRYARGDRSEGAKHIKIRHLNNEGSEGYVSQKELLDLGESMRKYLAKYKEPFINKRNARVYEWQDDKGVRFRLVASNKSAGTPYTAELPRPADFEDIITFYSDRNLKKPMEFKTPALREADEAIRGGDTLSSLGTAMRNQGLDTATDIVPQNGENMIKGFSSSAIPANIASAGAGAATGAALDDKNRARGAFIGALGGLGLVNAPSLVSKLKGGAKVGEIAQDIEATAKDKPSILSNMRSYLKAVGANSASELKDLSGKDIGAKLRKANGKRAYQ